MVYILVKIFFCVYLNVFGLGCMFFLNLKIMIEIMFVNLIVFWSFYGDGDEICRD